MQNSILSGFRTSRLRILWSLCRQPLLAFRLLLVPLPFGSRLRAATGNFETRANANCTHRSCEVCCCAHNNHRLCKRTASYACEACSCLAGFIRSLSCHSPYACSAPRRKYDLSCSDIVYRHKTPSKKTTETRPDSGLSRPSENDTSLMLPQTFHCPESGQRSRPGFRLRNQARFESTPATVANHMGCKAVSQSHKTDTWLNQNTTFANNEIQTNTHTRQQTRTDANRQSNRHSLSIANNDRHPKDLSTTQTWADNIQSDA